MSRPAAALLPERHPPSMLRARPVWASRAIFFLAVVASLLCLPPGANAQVLLLRNDTTAGAGPAATLPPATAYAQYNLAAVLQNTALYLGITAGALLAFAWVARHRRLAEFLMPKWFNDSLPAAWATGQAAPPRDAVVTALHSSLPSRSLSSSCSPSSLTGDGGVAIARFNDLAETAAEKDARRPPGSTTRCATRCAAACCLPRAEAARARAYGAIAWLWAPWTTTEEEYIQRVGMDGYLVVRTARLVLWMMVGLLPAAAVLLPVYVALELPCPYINRTDGDAALSGTCNLSYTYEGNISCACGLLQAASIRVGAEFGTQLISAVVVGAAVAAFQFGLVAREFGVWVRVRRQYAAAAAPPQAYSVMVRYVPPALRCEVGLREFFERLFPGQVHAVRVVPAASRVGPLVARAEEVQQRLHRQHTIDKAYKTVHKRLRVVCPRCTPPRKSVAELERQQAQIMGELAQALADRDASVAFHAQRAAAAAAAAADAGPSASSLSSSWSSPPPSYAGADDQQQPAAAPAPAAVNRGSSGGARATTALTASSATATTVAAAAVGVVEPDRLRVNSNTAFVTFRSARTAALCAALRHRRGRARVFPEDMHAVPAREPRDVRWADVPQHEARGECPVKAVVALLAAALMLTWGSAVFVVGLYTSPSSLACALGRNCTTDDDGNVAVAAEPAALDVALSFVSPLFLQLLSALAGQFIGAIVNMLYLPYGSQVDQYTFVVNWVFQSLQNLLIYSVASTLLVDLVLYVEHPVELLKLLGSNIPAGASFFIVFVESDLVLTLVPLLFRWTWLLGCWTHVALCCTIPFRRSVYAPTFCDPYGVPTTPAVLAPSGPLSRVLFIFLLVNVYALLQPLIVAAGLVYAAVALAVHSHRVLAVQATRFDTGGLYWRDVYGVLAACVVLPQFVLLTVVLASGHDGLVVAETAVLVVTCGSFVALWCRHQRSIAAHLPLDWLQEMDSDGGQQGPDLAGDAVEGAVEGRGGVGGSAGATASSSSSSSAAAAAAAAAPGSIRAAAAGLAAPLNPIAPPRPIVVIPPHLWRGVDAGHSALGSRAYLSAAVARDAVVANSAGGGGGDCGGGAAVPDEHSAVFVYDFLAPVLRAARNLTQDYFAAEASGGQKQQQQQQQLGQQQQKRSESDAPLLIV